MINLAGCRAVLLARSDAAKQTDSLEQQIQRLREFATKKKLFVVAEISVDDPSIGGAATTKAVQDLLHRKDTENDFDVLILEDLPRLSRKDISHTMSMIRQIVSGGITLITPSLGAIGMCAFKPSEIHRTQFLERR